MSEDLLAPSSTKRRRVQRSDNNSQRYSSPDELGESYPATIPTPRPAVDTVSASRNQTRRVSIRRSKFSRSPSRSSSSDELMMNEPSYERHARPASSMSTSQRRAMNGGFAQEATPAISPSRQRSHSRSRSPRSRDPTRSPSRSRSRGASRSQSRTPARRSRSRSESTPRSESRTPSRTPRSRSPTSNRSSPRSRSRSRYETASQGSRAASPSKPAPYEPIRPAFRAKLALHGHTHAVSQVRISPDGRWIATASADATVRLWNASTGAHMDTLVGHLAGVSCVAWSPDGDTLASGSDDKSIRLWDRVTGRPKKSAKGPVAARNAALASMKPLLGHHNYLHCLAFSPKGNMLASGSYDEAVFLWDVRAGRLMRSLPAHSDPVTGIDFSQDGTLVVSCSTDGLIRVWDTLTGQCLRTLVHEDNPGVANVCFSPNGRFVLAFTLDNCIRLWDYVAGSVKKTYQGHRNERFAVGGCFGTRPRRGGGGGGEDAFIASASEDGAVVLWDVKSKEVVQVVRAHEGVCFWVDIAGGLMVSCGEDRVVKIYKDDTVVSPVAREVNGDEQRAEADQEDGEDGEGALGVEKEEDGDEMDGVEMELRIKQEDTPIEGA